MIKLDLSLAIFFYLFFTVIIIFILWVWFERSAGGGAFSQSRKNVWQCHICGHIYTEEKTGDFSRCPQCKSINERKKPKEVRVNDYANRHSSR